MGEKRREEIKWILFDVGGVLQRSKQKRKRKKNLHFSGVHENIAKKLKLNLDQYFDSIDSWYVKSIEGKISEEDLKINLSKNLKVYPSFLEKIYVQQYKKKFKRNDFLYSLIPKLKKSFSIGILSDQWHLSKKALLPKKDLDKFETKIISCDVGTRKPDEEIFKIALEKTKVSPSQILFIDDQEWNILAAHKFGFKTILFMDNKKIKSQLKKFGIKI
jgi:epoxide hydrolase-like predicted phosphatase